MTSALEHAQALYLDGIRDGEPRRAAAQHIGERYTQHSTGVKDGPDGFVEFFEAFVERNPDREIDIVRAFEDGDFVFMHAAQRLDGGQSRWITMDILQADAAGRMIEHWDVIAEWVDESVSGHSQIDGPTEPADLDKTEQNKAIVRSFIRDVLSDGKDERITDYISTESYIQHNPLVGDGLDGLGTFMSRLAADGGSMVYLETPLVVGNGDMVATLSRVDLSGAEMAVMDLFRVADGRIVEHWDVMEPVPADDELVNSGKF